MPEPNGESPEPLRHVLRPGPVSVGIFAWCGYPSDHPRMAGALLTSRPEDVTCRVCISTMRMTLRDLEHWVPRLPGEAVDG